jgi:hypothetical protein
MTQMLVINLIIYLKIFINDFYYANICKHEKNMTKLCARLCLKLMLNKLKEMKDPTFIYILLGT